MTLLKNLENNFVILYSNIAQIGDDMDSTGIGSRKSHVVLDGVSHVNTTVKIKNANENYALAA